MQLSMNQERRPRVSWVSQDYHRTPWVRVKYGEKILPPNEQLSNSRLTDADALRRRDEAIYFSDARPISGGDGGNKEMLGGTI